MNSSDRERLRKAHTQLLDDLSPRDVLPLLLQEGVFSDDDQERILAEKTRRDRMDRLLSLLPYRGRSAYKVFREALLADYKWIVQRLDAMDVSSTEPMEEPKGKSVTEINHKVLARVAYHPDVLRDWKRVARSLGLEEADLLEVEFANAMNVREASYQALVKWYNRLGRRATPAALVAGLRQSELLHLADELEGK